MNLTKINKINIYCSMLYVLYALLTLTLLGYGVYFLQNLGFQYIEIGMAIGISALVSSIMQPLLGRLVDIKQYSWKNVLMMLSLVMLLACMAIFVLPNAFLIFPFALMVIILGCMYPFLNNAVFYYEHHGIKTNFGISRGFGSLSYMIFAAIVGFILVRTHVMVINAFSLLASVLMIITVFLLPYYGFGSSRTIKVKSKKFKDNVLLKYPVFTMAFIAISLFMIFHQVFMCYMINIFENVGGNITDVSIANSIGALLELPAMFLFARILQKISVRNIVIIASLLYVVRALVIFFAQTTTGIYISLILHTLTFALIIPASVYLTDEIISSEDQHEGQAFMGATLTIGVIFANLIAGNILQAFHVHHLLVFLVIVTVLGGIFALSTLKIGKNQQ